MKFQAQETSDQTKNTELGRFSLLLGPPLSQLFSELTLDIP